MLSDIFQTIETSNILSHTNFLVFLLSTFMPPTFSHFAFPLFPLIMSVCLSVSLARLHSSSFPSIPFILSLSLFISLLHTHTHTTHTHTHTFIFSLTLAFPFLTPYLCRPVFHRCSLKISKYCFDLDKKNIKKYLKEIVWKMFEIRKSWFRWHISCLKTIGRNRFLKKGAGKEIYEEKKKKLFLKLKIKTVK